MTRTTATRRIDSHAPWTTAAPAITALDRGNSPEPSGNLARRPAAVAARQPRPKQPTVAVRRRPGTTIATLDQSGHRAVWRSRGAAVVTEVPQGAGAATATG
ncbi:hypothetical protein ACIQFZ_17420 [Streptomyces sp. NPDC093064]|uniref:hypothetical protein n=1 Tax=Streptomyces sp. NPDC093064 TaxID=3366020 RepID=UPI0037F6493F